MLFSDVGQRSLLVAEGREDDMNIHDADFHLDKTQEGLGTHMRHSSGTMRGDSYAA